MTNPKLLVLLALALAACTTDDSHDDDNTFADDPPAATGASGTPTPIGDPCLQPAEAYGALFGQVPPLASLEAYLASAGTQWNMAQVFTPAISGRLARVSAALTWSGGPFGTAVVSLIDLTGDANRLLDRTFIAESHVLATAQVTVSDRESFVDAAFANLPTVAAGKPYAIEIYVPTAAPAETPVAGAGAVLWDAFNPIAASQIDPYPRGGAFLRNPTTANQWIASPTAFGVADQVFKTFVVPAGCR